MLVSTRQTVSTTIPVFDTGSAAYGTSSVPVKITIDGPFLEVDASSNPPSPPVQLLRVGFNLLAPHVWATTTFDTAFGGSGSVPAGDLYSNAIAFERKIIANSNSTIWAEIVERFVTERAAVPPFVPPGVIRPELSYWVRVAETSPQVTPTLTAAGPGSGSFYDPFGP